MDSYIVPLLLLLYWPYWLTELLHLFLAQSSKPEPWTNPHFLYLLCQSCLLSSKSLPFAHKAPSNTLICPWGCRAEFSKCLLGAQLKLHSFSARSHEAMSHSVVMWSCGTHDLATPSASEHTHFCHSDPSASGTTVGCWHSPHIASHLLIYSSAVIGTFVYSMRKHVSLSGIFFFTLLFPWTSWMSMPLLLTHCVMDFLMHPTFLGRMGVYFLL